MGGWIESDPNWKKVRASKTVQKDCPRCHNRANFELVTEAEGISFGGLFTILPLRRYYALKCPICIHFELVSNDRARELQS